MSITLILVVMTGIISYQAFNNPSMKQQLLFYPVAVKEQGQLFRFLSHGFVHSNWTHLLVNMYVLYIFGEYCEFRFSLLFGEVGGRIAYLLFYLTAIIAASIPSYLRHQGNRYYRALGASGATSAIVFTYVLFNPWNWFLFPPLPAIIFGIAYLWYSNYMDKKGGDNIGHNAHFWGAVYGLVFIVVSIFAINPAAFQEIVANLMSGPTPPPFFSSQY